MANKVKVILDSFNDMYPNNGTPQSLTGVKEVVLSNCNLGSVEILMHLISPDVDKNTSLYLPTDQEIVTIDMYDNNNNRVPWKEIFFIATNAPKNQKATFDLELVNI